MIEWFFATRHQYPEIAIVLALGLGYDFGSFTFKGIGLGAVTATLLAAVIIGHSGPVLYGCLPRPVDGYDCASI
jgi:putative transport protein